MHCYGSCVSFGCTSHLFTDARIQPGRKEKTYRLHQHSTPQTQVKGLASLRHSERHRGASGGCSNGSGLVARRLTNPRGPACSLRTPGDTTQRGNYSPGGGRSSRRKGAKICSENICGRIPVAKNVRIRRGNTRAQDQTTNGDDIIRPDQPGFLM